MFSLTDWLSFGEGAGGIRLKLDVKVQEGGRILEVAGRGGWGVMKIGRFSWTSYVYSPLTMFFWLK